MILRKDKGEVVGQQTANIMGEASEMNHGNMMTCWTTATLDFFMLVCWILLDLFLLFFV